MRLAVVAVAIALSLLPPVSGQYPVSHSACQDAPQPEVFASDRGPLENLVFDGAGHLYTTTIDGRLMRFTPDGAGKVIWQTARTGLASPFKDELLAGQHSLAGLALHPDGTVYVGQGLNFTTPVDGRVWRLDAATDEVSLYAEGFDSVNGLEFDREGNLYVGPGFDRYVDRIPAADPDAWDHWVDLYGVNGVVLDPAGDSLLAALSWDQSSRIVRLDLDDEENVTVVANLTFGVHNAEGGPHEPSDPSLPVAQKTLDDLEVSADGERIYVTGHFSYEVLRVDVDTGDACRLAATGASEPTAVAIAAGFGDHDGDVFWTGFGGEIMVLPGLETTSDGPDDGDDEAAAPPPTQEAAAPGLVVTMAVALTVVRRLRLKP